MWCALTDAVPAAAGGGVGQGAGQVAAREPAARLGVPVPRAQQGLLGRRERARHGAVQLRVLAADGLHGGGRHIRREIQGTAAAGGDDGDDDGSS